MEELLEKAKFYWLIETPSIGGSLYFTMTMQNGKPIWTPSIFDAKKFELRDTAEAVKQEWDLNNCRVEEFAFI